MIETERLRVEPLAGRHAQAFLAYYERNRAHLEPWEPQRTPEFYTLAFQREELAKIELATERGTGERFVAFEHSGHEIVASVNLHNIRRGVIYCATLGYAVDADRQGRGYATEAVGAVIRYAFDTLNLHRLETSYQPSNERSGRVLRKLGFTVEGYSRDYLRINSAWRDGIRVSLVNQAWRP